MSNDITTYKPSTVSEVKAEGAGQDWCCGQKEACQLVTWRGNIVWCEHDNESKSR